jgi:sugar lactone lactonase YvrE
MIQNKMKILLLTLWTFGFFAFSQEVLSAADITGFSVSGKSSVLSFNSETTGPGLLHLRITAGTSKLYSKHHFKGGNSSHTISLKGMDRSQIKDGVLYFEAEFHFRNYVFEKYIGGTGKSEKRFNAPTSIISGPRERLYVVDEGNDRVQIFDWNYRYLSEFGGFAWNGSRGTNEAQKIRFDHPSSITAVNQRELYITDSLNNRVVRCDLQGRYVGEFSNEIVRLPAGITSNNQNELIVCDTGNDRILRYKSPDIFDAKLGSYGWSTRQFNKPQNPCFDNSGNLYITDSGNKRIQVFDPNLRPAFQIKLEGVTPSSVYVDDDYFTYVTDVKLGRVIILDNKFEAIAQLPSKGDAFSLTSPVCVVVTPDSRLHIVDKTKNVIALVKIEQTMILRRGKVKVGSKQ